MKSLRVLLAVSLASIPAAALAGEAAPAPALALQEPSVGLRQGTEVGLSLGEFGLGMAGAATLLATEVGAFTLLRSQKSGELYGYDTLGIGAIALSGALLAPLASALLIHGLDSTAHDSPLWPVYLAGAGSAALALGGIAGASLATDGAGLLGNPAFLVGIAAAATCLVVPAVQVAVQRKVRRAAPVSNVTVAPVVGPGAGGFSLQGRF